jgi:hypothetical protein
MALEGGLEGVHLEVSTLRVQERGSLYLEGVCHKPKTANIPQNTLRQIQIVPLASKKLV